MTAEKTLSINDVNKMTLEQQLDLLFEMLDPYDWNYGSQISVLDEIRTKVGLTEKYFKQEFKKL